MVSSLYTAGTSCNPVCVDVDFSRQLEHSLNKYITNPKSSACFARFYRIQCSRAHSPLLHMGLEIPILSKYKECDIRILCSWYFEGFGMVPGKHAQVVSCSNNRKLKMA